MKRAYLTAIEVIDLLKSGEIIECRVNDYYSSRGRLNYSSTRYRIAGRLIHNATVSSMIRRKVIHGPDIDPHKKYQLIN